MSHDLMIPHDSIPIPDVSATHLTVINALWAHVATADPAVRDALTQACSYYPTGFDRDWRFTSGWTDGRVVLYERDQFPTGLIARALLALEDAGLAYTVDGNPLAQIVGGLRPLAHAWEDGGTPLRDYQEAAVTACLTNMRGVVEMATGTGKTLVFSKVIACLGLPALVVVPTKDLLYQTAERLRCHLPTADVRTVGDGSYLFGHDVTVGLFPTLAQHRPELQDDLDRIRVVVSDEAHHAQSRTWHETLMACPAPYRFAFSATPWTNEPKRVWFPVRGGTPKPRTVDVGSDLLVEAATGVTIYSYTSRQAVAEGHLTLPHVWLIRLSGDYTVPDPPDGSWAALYDAGIVNHTERNERLVDVITELASGWGKVMVLVQRVAHGEGLAQTLRSRRVRATFLSGSAPVATRQKVLRGFQGTEYDVVVSTKIFDEGIDVPEISAVVFAGGGKADHKTVQRVGRGMRRGGRDRLIVVDVRDNAHGILAHHAKRRIGVYRREGWEIDDI